MRSMDTRPMKVIWESSPRSLFPLTMKTILTVDIIPITNPKYELPVTFTVDLSHICLLLSRYFLELIIFGSWWGGY